MISHHFSISAFCRAERLRRLLIARRHFEPEFGEAFLHHRIGHGRYCRLVELSEDGGRSELTIATCAVVSAIGAGAALAASPHLGKPINQADLAEWDINILPDGSNLPPGSGRAADGAKIFGEKCAFCHGDHGQGGIAARLIGGPPKAGLDGGKTIANYWPYATTLFDFIRRSMPFIQPRSLTDDEVYSLVAYLLAENKLIGENDEINSTTLPQVRMPNRDNFIVQFPDRM